MGVVAAASDDRFEERLRGIERKLNALILPAGTEPQTQHIVYKPWIFYANDGTNARFALLGPSGSQFWALYDEQGNILISDDSSAGQGLARPYIPWRAMPMSEVTTPPQSTTSSSFVALHRSHGVKQHPRIRVDMIIQADSGTTGEARLVASSGDVIGGVLSIPSAANTYGQIVGAIPGDHMQATHFDVQARRVSGAGSVRVGIADVYGVQS